MDYLKINKESWNKRTEVHYDSEFYDNDNFKKTVLETGEGETQLTLKELAPVRLIKNKFFNK